MARPSVIQSLDDAVGHVRAGDPMEVVLVELSWPDGPDGPNGTIRTWAFAPTDAGDAP